MNDFKYPHLFTPLEIGNVVFRNRIFASPQGYYNCGGDCYPTAEYAAFYEQKARGGFASVCVGDCIVDTKTGVHYPFLIKIDDPNTLPGLSMTAAAITRHGAVASAELSHGGMYSKSIPATGRPLYGPVEMEGSYGHVTEMPESVIYDLIDAYGRAAAFAKQAGFSMVTIHGGHAWLLSQFMSPKLNTRKDMWGGSLENRMRFPLAVVESIRKRVGSKFPIEYRMSGSECNPDGYDIDDGIQMAMALDGKVDIIHVSAGDHERPDATIITHPSLFCEDGCNAKFAAEIKKHVKTCVATVGAFTDPDQMEEIIASGRADIIELGRQTLADPDFPIKARTGREDEIQRCMRCSECFGASGAHRIFYCALNPEIGHELEAKMTPPPKVKKRVLVVGGGVGGMQAAITAHDRGHEVILCEKGPVLGGALRCEARVPFKKKLSMYLDRQAMLISRRNIDVRLNTEVTPELAESLHPDYIIAALGSTPVVPKIPGIEGKNVVSAEAVYLDPSLAGKNPVILGAGLVGIELAIFLDMLGTKARLIELADRPTIDEFSFHSIAINEEIKNRRIEINLSTTATKIAPEGVYAVGPDGTEKLFEADTVIYAVGQKPLRAEAESLAFCAKEFAQIGDCVTPKNIITATQAAYTTANDIGRI